MNSSFSVKSFVMHSGERFCLLVNKNNGMPLFYPNLYVTTQVRNRSLSFSAMQSELGAIAVLLKFMGERGDDIEIRFRQLKFFEVFELDAIRDFCQISFKKRTMNADSHGIFNLAELQEADEKVSSQTCYVRLSFISNYIKWLAEIILGANLEKNVAQRISKMTTELKARRPVSKGRNNGLVEKGLNEAQLEMLFELFSSKSIKYKSLKSLILPQNCVLEVKNTIALMSFWREVLVLIFVIKLVRFPV